MNPERFYLDIINDILKREVSFLGFTNGERWNGWATPYLPKESADALIEAMRECEMREPSITFGAAYHPNQDAYSFQDQDQPEEVYTATSITVNGEATTVYPIGTYLWTWGTYIGGAP